MQLDRFTEKAQEAIVAAQQLAERLQSPLLDAEPEEQRGEHQRRGDEEEAEVDEVLAEVRRSP